MIQAIVLKELVAYDAMSGELTWRHRDSSFFKSERDCAIWNKRFSGKPAGCVSKNRGKSYVRLSVLSKRYMGHTIAWALFHGGDSSRIDHIDGDGLNNSINNLRQFTQAENNRNTKMRKDNKSGATGVCKKGSKWVAYINNKGVKVHLGSFDDKYDAIKTRKEKEKEYVYFESHGK